MTYRIQGLDPTPYRHLFGLDDAALAARDMVRMVADVTPSYPCRATLDDAEPGEALLLFNHVSHPDGPYRASHAIFISEQATAGAVYEDSVPPALERRILSLRAFNADGLMSAAALAQPGEGDAVIRKLLADPAVDHIDAHNATRGCFAARIERG